MKTRTSLMLIALAVLGLVAVQPAHAATLYWSGTNTWDNATTVDWGTVTGGPYNASAWVGASDANFEGTAGTVTVSGTIASVKSITFATDGYTLTGGTITMTGAGVTTGAGSDTIGSVIGGTVGLTKSGAGTLVLSGANTFTGILTINRGTVTVDAGAGGSLNGNALKLGSSGGGRGTFIYDNTTSAGATAQSLGAFSFGGLGDQTVQLTRTALQTTSLTFSSMPTGNLGYSVNFVIDGTPGANGIDSKIVFTGQAAGFLSGTTKDYRFFNGADFVWYDAGGFVRGINYGTDAGTATSAGTAFTGGAGVHQEVTGTIASQPGVTLKTLKIKGTSNITVTSGTLSVTSGADTGAAVLKTGGGTSTIYGGFSLSIQGAGCIRVDRPDDVLIIDSGNAAGGSKMRLVKSGAGTLILRGASSWGSGVTGGISDDYINGGTLELGGAGTMLGTNQMHIASGALFRFNSSAAQSFIRVIDGDGSLTVAGSGTLTLSGDNTYTGATTISGGTLQIGNGGTTGTLSTSSAITNDGTLIFNRAGTITQGTNFASLISGLGGVTKTGTGTLVFTGANAYTGNTALNQGFLQLSPSGTDTMLVKAISRSVGAAADFNPGSGLIRTTTGNSNGIIGGWATYSSNDWAVGSPDGTTLTNVAAATYTNTSAALDVPANYTNNNMNVDSSQAPTGAITPNSLRFNTAAAYTLTLQSANTIQSGGILVGTTVANNLSRITGGTLTNGTELIVIQNNASNSLEIGSAITGGGIVSKWGAGTLILSGANAYTGTTTLYAGTTRFAGTMAAGSAVTINGNAIAQSGAAAGLPADSTVTFGPGSTSKLQLNGYNTTIAGLNSNATTVGTPIVESGSGTVGTDILTVDNGTGATSTFAGKLQNGSTRLLGLTKTGAGTLRLTGTNTYTGGTLVTGGILSINGSAATNNAATLNGGTLYLDTGATYPTITVGASGGTISNSSGGHAGGGHMHITNDITGAGNLYYYGYGDDRFDKGGGVYSLTGDFVVMDVQDFMKIGASFPNSTLDLRDPVSVGSFTNPVWGGLKGTASLALSDYTGTLSIGNNNKDTTYSGVMSGTTGLGLTKIGTGKWTLTGTNTYNGATTVSNGTLEISGTGSINQSSGVSINGANAKFLQNGSVANSRNFTVTQGTLGGTGTITGTVNVNSGGTLAPGASLGTLKVGATTIDGTFLVDVDATGASDLLEVTGDLALSGSSILSIVDPNPLTPGFDCEIATYTGSLTGTFGSTPNLPGGWYVDYGVKTAKTITLVPEPATLALLALGGLGLILGRKRK